MNNPSKVLYLTTKCYKKTAPKLLKLFLDISNEFVTHFDPYFCLILLQKCLVFSRNSFQFWNGKRKFQKKSFPKFSRIFWPTFCSLFFRSRHDWFWYGGGAYCGWEPGTFQACHAHTTPFTSQYSLYLRNCFAFTILVCSLGPVHPSILTIKVSLQLHILFTITDTVIQNQQFNLEIKKHSSNI